MKVMLIFVQTEFDREQLVMQKIMNHLVYHLFDKATVEINVHKRTAGNVGNNDPSTEPFNLEVILV